MESNRDIIINIASERLLHKNGAPYSRQAIHIVNGTNTHKTKYKLSPKDFARCTKTEDELISALGRKWRTQLPKLGQFVFFCSKNAQTECIKLPDGEPLIFKRISIASTSNSLIAHFKNPKAIARIIANCLKIGYLVRITEKYRFGNPDKNRNYPYEYACNDDVGSLIRSTCKNRKIRIPRMVANAEDAVALLTNQKKEDKEGKEEPPEGTSQATITSGASLVDRFAETVGLSPHEVENFSLAKHYLGMKNVKDCQIKSLAQWKYKELVEPREKKIAAMNIGLPWEEQIRFEPNVKRNKKGRVERVGWRATSSFTSFKAHEGGDPNYKGQWRDEYLRKTFKGEACFEYDVRASIYQISHLLDTGEWIGNAGDPYETMFGGKFNSAEDREAYKDFCMALYFDGPSRFISHNNRTRIPECLKRYGKDRIKDAVSFAWRGIERFTGRSLFNEVFLHESLLYIDFVHELRMNQIDVAQVYDGFYIKSSGFIGTQELEERMAANAMNYYVDYREWKNGRRRRR